MTKPHTRDLSIATQLGRVIAIMSDGKARTLRDIERECWSRYGHADTQAAISARLREVCCCGWVKHSSHQVIDGKQVWHYHLTPFPTTEAVAALGGGSMRLTHAIAAVLAATAAQTAWFNPLDFKPGHGFCIPNPRNDRAAQRQRAAAKRRNKSKRG